MRCRAMHIVWRLGPLLALALAPVGCAHQTGALAPGGSPVSAGAAGAPGNSAPRGEAPAAAVNADPEVGDSSAAADRRSDDLAAEDDLDELDALDAPSPPVADPLAPWNRAMFQFNDKFYFWFLKPVARAYRTVVPSLARTGVENFFNNLGAPKRFVSNLLQLKGREATIEMGKFMINSTWGVLGFGNLFAGNTEVQIPEADLGLTLAHYGVGSGPYIVWPFLGYYTLRDTTGWTVGLLIDPISYIHPITASLGTRTYSMVNYTSFRIGDYEVLKDASLDPYLATRDAYLQYRAEKVKE